MGFPGWWCHNRREAAGAIKEDKVDQKAINQLMQSSPEYRQRALCENCESLEERIKVLEDALMRITYELGVPQPGYPQPVANAYDIAQASLEVK